MDRTHCDKCLSPITDGECSCGRWFDKGELPTTAQIFEEAILAFNLSQVSIASGDHHSGSCFIFFKGNHDKCMFIRRLIEKINNEEKKSDN